MKRYLWLILFVTVLIAVPLLLIVPNVKAIDTTSERILEEYQHLEERNQRGRQIRRTQEDYERLSPRLPDLDAFTVKSGNELSFITAVERLADIHTVQESIKLDFDAKKKKNGLETIPVTVTVQGTYRNAVSFVHGLQALPPVVIIRTIQMQPTGQTNDIVTMTATGYLYTN